MSRAPAIALGGALTPSLLFPDAEVNRGAEPPRERSVKRAPDDDERAVINFVNSLAATLVLYAGVTRGSLVVARGLERLVRTPE